MPGWRDREKEWWELLIKYLGLLGFIWECIGDQLEHGYVVPVFWVMMGLDLRMLPWVGRGDKNEP